MFSPSEFLLASEEKYTDEVTKLYECVLVGFANNPDDPTAVNEFAAKTITGMLWRMRRAGIDAEVVQEQVIAKGYHEGRINQWAQAHDRARELTSIIGSIDAIRLLHSTLAAPAAAPALRLVGDGSA